MAHSTRWPLGARCRKGGVLVIINPKVQTSSCTCMNEHRLRTATQINFDGEDGWLWNWSNLRLVVKVKYQFNTRAPRRGVYVSDDGGVTARTLYFVLPRGATEAPWVESVRHPPTPATRTEVFVGCKR